MCDTGFDLMKPRNSQGYSLLNLAVALNAVEIASYLSLRVRNVDQENPHGLTPFQTYALN